MTLFLPACILSSNYPFGNLINRNLQPSPRQHIAGSAKNMVVTIHFLHKSIKNGPHSLVKVSIEGNEYTALIITFCSGTRTSAQI